MKGQLINTIREVYDKKIHLLYKNQIQNISIHKNILRKNYINIKIQLSTKLYDLLMIDHIIGVLSPIDFIYTLLYIYNFLKRWHMFHYITLKTDYVTISLIRIHKYLQI